MSTSSFWGTARPYKCFSRAKAGLGSAEAQLGCTQEAARSGCVQVLRAHTGVGLGCLPSWVFIFGLCLHTSLSPRGGVCFSCTGCYLEGCGLPPRQTPRVRPAARCQRRCGRRCWGSCSSPAQPQPSSATKMRGKEKYSGFNKGGRCGKDGAMRKDGRILIDERRSHLDTFRVSPQLLTE